MSFPADSPMKRILRYGPMLFWVAFIWFASTNEFSSSNTSQLLRPIVRWLVPNISEAQLAAVHFATRKLGHFTEYAILAFLTRRALIGSSLSFLRRSWFSLTLFLIAIYALIDEFHQSFVPSRTASVYDSAIDLAGGLTVLLIFKFAVRSRTITPASA
jgi:VanZ family protein